MGGPIRDPEGAQSQRTRLALSVCNCSMRHLATGGSDRDVRSVGNWKDRGRVAARGCGRRQRERMSVSTLKARRRVAGSRADGPSWRGSPWVPGLQRRGRCRSSADIRSRRSKAESPASALRRPRSLASCHTAQSVEDLAVPLRSPSESAPDVVDQIRRSGRDVCLVDP